MKKVIMVILFVSTGFQLYTISSVMNHRLTTSSPLLYKVMDYTDKKLSIEFEPWVAGMFDSQHTIANLTPDNRSSLLLDQLGRGDINPEWILLAANDSNADYQSIIELTPQLSMYGLLFHCYKQFEYFYFDIKTALVACTSQIKLAEAGGDNGMLAPSFPSMNNEVIYNAHDAFTQADWNYGKIGESHKLIGFENIQVTLGSTATMNSFSSESYTTFISGFGLFEIPTGSGTHAYSLFEPQVGTNHWAVGLGGDFLLDTDNGFKLILGANGRYILSEWETRSFDLVNNGPWSRYLGIDIIGADTSVDIGIPGINLFTQSALIDSRSQVNAYARLQKKIQNCVLELSYNYLYNQAENISDVTTIAPGYGIFNMYAGLGGGTTVTNSTAKINESDPFPDATAVELVTSDLDLKSGAAGEWSSSMIAARVQHIQDFYTYGFGAAVDLAHSAQAISSWSVWANFEILL